MTSWTESDLEDALQCGDASVQGETDSGAKSTSRSASMQAVAKGMQPRGQMNQTERRFAQVLDALDEVWWWVYEAIRVRYGDGWHAPDFFVMLEDYSLVVVEVKAHCTDAGRTRFKAAAGQLSVLRWVMVVQRSKQQPWTCRYDTADEGGSPFV